MRIRRIAHIASLAALLPAGLATPAAALIFRDVPALQEIAAQAPLAFRGVVLDVSYGDAALDETTSTPYTLTRFEVVQAYRGTRAGETVTIARIGGPRNGDMRRYLLIPGLASFAAGEEVVVFADDVAQPFFGTLFGDIGALRVARVAGGEDRIVLSYHFRPLVATPAGFGVAPDRRCEPVIGERNVCALTADRIESGDEGQAGGPAAAPAMTAGAFDQAIAAIVAAHPQARPAQTVSGDPVAFTEALRQLDSDRR